MNARKKTKAITFSGLTIALIVVLMFMASIIDVLDYTISAICGILVTFILIEFGTASALSVYLGASILSLIIVPSKINAILFIAFCGWYPFIKRALEKVREPVGTILKFAVFNISITVIIAISKAVFLFENTSAVWYVLLYALCNFTFLLYDLLITKLIFIYVHKYRKKFKFLN